MGTSLLCASASGQGPDPHVPCRGVGRRRARAWRPGGLRRGSGCGPKAKRSRGRRGERSSGGQAPAPPCALRISFSYLSPALRRGAADANREEKGREGNAKSREFYPSTFFRVIWASAFPYLAGSQSATVVARLSQTASHPQAQDLALLFRAPVCLAFRLLRPQKRGPWARAPHSFPWEERGQGSAAFLPHSSPCRDLVPASLLFPGPASCRLPERGPRMPPGRLLPAPRGSEPSSFGAGRIRNHRIPETRRHPYVQVLFSKFLSAGYERRWTKGDDTCGSWVVGT